MTIFADSMDEKFWEYHRNNPQVYTLFVRFARQVRQAGHNHYSAKAIVERVRWHMAVETGGDEFKLNNNYTSRYARMLVRQYEEFEGFFKYRALSTYSNLEDH